MTDPKISQKSTKKVKTLDEQISAQREKLRKLEDAQKEQLRRERERNQRAVLELIKSERLDAVSPDLWRKAMPKIKSLLLVDEDKTPPKQPEPKEPPVGPASAGTTT